MKMGMVVRNSSLSLLLWLLSPSFHSWNTEPGTSLPLPVSEYLVLPLTNYSPYFIRTCQMIAPFLLCLRCMSAKYTSNRSPCSESGGLYCSRESVNSLAVLTNGLWKCPWFLYQCQWPKPHFTYEQMETQRGWNVVMGRSWCLNHCPHSRKCVLLLPCPQRAKDLWSLRAWRCLWWRTGAVILTSTMMGSWVHQHRGEVLLSVQANALLSHYSPSCSIRWHCLACQRTKGSDGRRRWHFRTYNTSKPDFYRKVCFT